MQKAKCRIGRLTLPTEQSSMPGASSGLFLACQNRVAQVLGKQVLRSGTSLGANYREASRARSKAEFIAKMGDWLKELGESEYWLDLLSKENVVPPARLAPLLKETSELIAIFVTSIKTARGR